MIVRLLVDYNNEGYLYCFTVSTEDKERLFETLKKYSRDVRYIETKSAPGKMDKGTRKLEDGSVILRCQCFGDKYSARFAFKNSPGRWNIIEKAVSV